MEFLSNQIHIFLEKHMSIVFTCCNLVMNNSSPQLIYSKCSLECLDMTWHDDDRSYITPLIQESLPHPTFTDTEEGDSVYFCPSHPSFPQHHMCVLGCLFITSVSPPHPITFLTKETCRHTHTYVCVCVYIYIDICIPKHSTYQM